MFSATLARPLHCRTHFHDHLTLQSQQSNTGSPLLFTTTAKTKPKNLANFLALSCFICRFYVCVTETFVKNVFVITWKRTNVVEGNITNPIQSYVKLSTGIPCDTSMLMPALNGWCSVKKRCCLAEETYYTIFTTSSNLNKPFLKAVCGLEFRFWTEQKMHEIWQLFLWHITNLQCWPQTPSQEYTLAFPYPAGSLYQVFDIKDAKEERFQADLWPDASP